jgi:hypothetical protein
MRRGAAVVALLSMGVSAACSEPFSNEDVLYLRSLPGGREIALELPSNDLVRTSTLGSHAGCGDGPVSEFYLSALEMSDDINDQGLSRKHILDSIDKSLQRLQMDYVDLYQIHRWDYGVPIEETLEALNDVVRAGKARYIGASSIHSGGVDKEVKAMVAISVSLTSNGTNSEPELIVNLL